MTARIVLLNGVSSVGKSSIARAIQAAASRVYLAVSLDDFIGMMPFALFGDPKGYVFNKAERDGKPVVTIASGPEMERTMRGMRHAAAALAAQGNNLVVDDVIFDAAALEEYRTLLTPYDLKTVGVFAPLDVLEAREAARGDRAIGLARGQIDIVHQGVAYDFEVDTAAASAEECARAIVARFGL